MKPNFPSGAARFAQTLTATIESRHMVMIARDRWYGVEAPPIPPMPAIAHPCQIWISTSPIFKPS